MIKFGNREELHAYLNKVKLKTGIDDYDYFIIEYEGVQQPYHFSQYGDNFVEWQCSLLERTYTEEELVEYIRLYWDEDEFEEILTEKKKRYKNGCLTELAFELMPLYLVGKMKLINVLNEAECIDWLTDRKSMKK